MKSAFSNLDGARIMERMITAIQEQKQYLSDIDGAIGDGDHGINMNKGFTMAREALGQDPGDLSHGLKVLSKVLLMRIGGSMGPLYGSMFKTMGNSLENHASIDAAIFRQTLLDVKAVMERLSPARIGDKTLVDALYPAIDAYVRILEEGAGFTAALKAMKAAAEEGRDATREMVARLGRSSRLGERSRGTIDAGAASCALILGAVADGITALLSEPE
jgi:dihydroxyacetone kinase-like protein